MLEDLQEARDGLNQTAQNSSRPAGSFAPWEGGRAAEPVEAQLIAEIRQAELLHADETGWKEKGRLLWLWVLITPNVTLFLMGRRSWEVIAEVLEGFAGWPYVTG